MKHFIVYHNTEKMGRSLREDNPFELLTNKPVQHLLQSTVWFITDEGKNPRRYNLGGVFLVNEVGNPGKDGFKYSASGKGQDPLPPPIPINDEDWFPELVRVTGHFGLGAQEIKDEAIIAGLTRIASEAGYEV